MPKVTVVGSYVVDLMSRTRRMPVPGETVIGGPFKMGPGGKGSNQAIAAARLCADVTMVTKVGNDDFGKSALETFKSEGINTELVRIDQENATGAALIAVDDCSENMIIVALGACGTLSRKDVCLAKAEISQSDMVLVQLETTIEAVTEAVNQANQANVPVILNPAPFQEFPLELLAKVDYLTPNETEASQLSGIDVFSEQTAIQAAEKLYKLGTKAIIITLGKKGCLLYNEAYKGKLIAGFEVEAVDTTGAGDAFNGGLAYALSSGHDLIQAIDYANATAALSVQKLGTAPAMPKLAEVEKLIRG